MSPAGTAEPCDEVVAITGETAAPCGQPAVGRTLENQPRCGRHLDAYVTRTAAAMAAQGD